MQFESELELHRQLARYLSGEISLNDFEDWFVPRSWNFHAGSTPSLQDIVSEIELLLAEYSNGHVVEEDLKQKLLPFATSYKVFYWLGDAPSSTIMSTSSVSAFPQSPELSSDIQFVVESW